MKIGELANRTGVNPKTIRYYEDIELLPEPGRYPNGYRDYGEGAVERLDFIRDAQAAGLTLAEIASVLDLRDQGLGTCDHVADLMERHLVELDSKLNRLRQTRTRLGQLAERARRLDRADCTDPNRCQTIVERSDHG